MIDLPITIHWTCNGDHLTYRHFLQDDAYLQRALMDNAGGNSESWDSDAKKEEEEEEEQEEEWNPAKWKEYGYGVRDATWLEGPASSDGRNPKAETKEEDWGGWEKKSSWGWQSWGGKYEDGEWGTANNRWKSNWNDGWRWKNPKPPWAYRKGTPHEGRYVKGGFEADGVFYESL